MEGLAKLLRRNSDRDVVRQAAFQFNEGVKGITEPREGGNRQVDEAIGVRMKPGSPLDSENTQVAVCIGWIGHAPDFILVEGAVLIRI